MAEQNRRNYLDKLIFLPIVAMVVVVALAVSLPPKPVVILEAFTEAVYLLLALYALLAIYRLGSKLIFFGWSLLCLGQTLDLLDEFVELNEVIHPSVEDWLAMVGIMLFAIGFNKQNKLLSTNLSQEQEKAEELSELAYTDKVTKIGNRSLVTHSLERLTESNTPYAVHFVDLVKFKPANDKYGHEVGDLILKAVAERLSNIARSTDTVGRWGGDEFIVVQNGSNDETAAIRFANRLHQAFSTPIEIQELSIEIGASIGAALYPKHGESYTDVIRKADIAMYLCKQQNGKPVLFDEKIALNT